MAIAGAARSVFRSSSAVRNATARFASEAKSTCSSPFRFATRKPLSNRIFSCPAEMSACLESMQPFHTATASALMTSMLTLSRAEVTVGFLKGPELVGAGFCEDGTRGPS